VLPGTAAKSGANRPVREPAEADVGGPSLEALVRDTSEHHMPIFQAKLH